MRCPKCGYISFDHLETCKKCHKSLGSVAEEINGTTFEAVAPLFLKITKDVEQKITVESVQKLDFDDIEPDEEQQSTIRPGIDTEFTLDAKPLATTEHRKEISFADQEKELVVDLDDFQEVAPRAEFDLDLDMPSEEEDSQLPPIDFGDLDISDLGPPSAVALEEPALSIEKDRPALEVESLQPESSSAPPPPPKSRTGRASSGLEDLNFNGLDLESPAKIVTGSAAGKRYLPSVKTGTALDKFDIDLGDLFADKKTEKNN